MPEWINNTLESGSFGLAALTAAFVLGVLSSVAAAGCSLPILGAIVGYSGMRKKASVSATLLVTVFFALGSIIALVIIGSVVGFVGQVAQVSLGRYWKIFAGVVAIIFGLAALKLLPFELPGMASESKARPRSLFGAAVFGLVVGGGVSICSLCCNPGIFVVLGVVILQGYSMWAIALMVAYAIGFALPLSAIMLGASFGTMMVKVKAAETAIRVGAGGLLIVAGFYFLATL